MIFLHAVNLGGIWMALLLSSGEASHLRADEHRNGRSYENSLHMQIASDPPVRSAVDTLNCVLGESEKAIRRNRDINCGAGNVETMDANALMEGEAKELRDEAILHDQRAQELEDIKRTQKRRHNSTMKGIQEQGQREHSEIRHELDLLKEAESSAKTILFKRDLDEQKHLLSEAQTHTSASNAVRLQQQNSKHKSRDEVAALIQYPLLGFSLPSSVNPIEYLTKYSTNSTAVQNKEASKTGSAGALSARSDRSEAAGRTSQQLLRDRIEILGDEATLEEVERKGKKAKASRKNKRPKKRGNESCKGECSIEEKVEDQRAEEEAEEEERESAPVKALHKVEHAVKSPFSSSDEHAIFSDSSEDAGISEDNFEGSMEDPDEEGAAPTATFAASNGEKDDDDEDGDRESSGSAEFNNKEPESANRKKKINDSEEGEDEGAENRQGEEKAQKRAASHNQGGVGKGASKNPVEATQEEAEQAKTLQRPQGMHPQQSFCCMKSRYGTNSTGPSSPHHSSGIHAAIESARSRFAAARKAASSTSSVDEDFEEEPSTPELTDEEEQPAGNSELARAENTVGTMSKQGALATEATKEMEATEGISTTEEEAARTQASPGEDHKLAAAAEEAQQAEKGLKICAHGSFLSCRQGQRRHSLR